MATRKTVNDFTDTNGPNTVQPYDVFGKGTGFVSAESVIVAAGLPAWDDNTLTDMIPIGLVENANIQQNKALQQLFEIGSRRPFFVPGRHQIQAAMSRVIFNGPSLMKALYYLVGEDTDGVSNASLGGINIDDLPGFGNFADTTEDLSADSDPLWINLASEMFNHPFGLAFLLKNMEGGNYGGVFLEECFVQAHQFSVASQQTVLLENVSLRAARVVGISAESMPGEAANNTLDAS